jgi:hypothetical protein
MLSQWRMRDCLKAGVIASETGRTSVYKGYSSVATSNSFPETNYILPGNGTYGVGDEDAGRT